MFGAILAFAALGRRHDRRSRNGFGHGGGYEQVMGGNLSGVAAFVRSAIALELAAAFPLVGWFAVLPLSSWRRTAQVFQPAALDALAGRRSRRGTGSRIGLIHVAGPPDVPQGWRLAGRRCSSLCLLAPLCPPR